MFDSLKNGWRSRYVRSLEDDVARLRAENRALTNSLLGTAGFPPLDFPDAAKLQPVPRTRRRSWHQIQAWKQSEAERDRVGNADELFDVRANGPVSHS